MKESAKCSADLVVRRPASGALALFTPEGERAWAPGWDPVYPALANAEGPGAVFTVRHGEATSVWIVVDQDARSIRYARVVPGHSAGTVLVAVLDAGASATRLRVSYEMTALGTEGALWLEGFVAGFDDYIAHWESAIAAAIES